MVFNGNALRLNPSSTGLIGRFHAMGCPCEIIMYGDLNGLKDSIQRAYDRVVALERKYSRYIESNIIARINTGQRVETDSETQKLLEFATRCYQLSSGLFDITSGVLRKVWRFGQGATLPSKASVESVLPLVGWHKVDWQPPYIQLQPGMEVDLGGIVKEYAVDQAAQCLMLDHLPGFLINLGGDIYVDQQDFSYPAWRIGIENPEKNPDITLKVHRGGIATSGSTHRYLSHQGRHYGHILNPQTGWPSEDSPKSVTVVAKSCTEAGLWSTLAMLQGAHAEAFLLKNCVQFSYYR